MPPATAIAKAPEAVAEGPARAAALRRRREREVYECRTHAPDERHRAVMRSAARSDDPGLVSASMPASPPTRRQAGHPDTDARHARRGYDDEIDGARRGQGTARREDGSAAASIAPGLDVRADRQSRPLAGALADITRNPAFDAGEVARVPDEQLAEIQQELTNPGALAGRVLPNLVYGPVSPYAKSSGAGDPKAVAADTRMRMIWLRSSTPGCALTRRRSSSSAIVRSPR